MNAVGNILKAGAIMCTVGLLLALAAPVLADLIGAATLGAETYAAAQSTPVLWTGAFFGTFGALHAAVSPVYNKILGAEPQLKPKIVGKIPAQGQARSRTVEVELEPACGLDETEMSDYFREQEEERRAAAAATPQSIQHSI